MSRSRNRESAPASDDDESENPEWLLSVSVGTVPSFLRGDRLKNPPDGVDDITVVSLASRIPAEMDSTTLSSGVSKSSWSPTLENADDWWYSNEAKSGTIWKDRNPFDTWNLGGSASTSLRWGWACGCERVLYGGERENGEAIPDVYLPGGQLEPRILHVSLVEDGEVLLVEDDVRPLRLGPDDAERDQLDPPFANQARRCRGRVRSHLLLFVLCCAMALCALLAGKGEAPVRKRNKKENKNWRHGCLPVCCLSPPLAPHGPRSPTTAQRQALTGAATHRGAAGCSAPRVFSE